MAKDKVSVKRETRHIAANILAIMLILLLSTISGIYFMRGQELVPRLAMLFVAMQVAFVLLLFIFKATSDFSNLAFFVPFVLFVVNLFVLDTNAHHIYFFLFVSFFICGISCLYTNYRQTFAYILLQAVAIMVLHFSGVSVTVYNAPLIGLGIFSAYLTSCFFLIVITKTATVDLRKISEEADSFKTYLSTTKNYLTILDRSNRVVYASNPIANLAYVENVELVKERPFIDLFANRELKLLAYRMLGRRELYEDTCEFTQYNQKRYFKAYSNGMAMKSGVSTLVTMLDMTDLAERDEIAAMKDSLKIGIFFMNREYVIQDNYSRYLEELLSDGDLKGKRFTDLIEKSLSAKELNAVKDYLDMVFDRSFDADTLREINPIDQLPYVDYLGSKKIFNCAFFVVELGKEETIVLVTIYDVTARAELQEQLQKEKKKRQDEMSNLFELLQVDAATFEVFQDDMEHAFGQIDDVMGNNQLTNQKILVEVYQLVHSIKSNAVTLGLNNFGSKVHDVESQIKKLRNIEGEVPFDDMLHLTIEIEKLVQEKNGFGFILDKINAFKRSSKKHASSSEDVFLETLKRTADKAAADMNKKVRFVAADIELTAIEKKHKRVMKDVLTQLIRNSVAHGVELPEERLSMEKSEIATIRLSVKRSDGNIHVSLMDDGRGLDFDKIREKALLQNLIKPEEAGSKKQLLNAIFQPGFSTADTEGIHAGRGIGLNLVRDRVRDIHGTIKLQTESGKGTVFNILFPVGTGETTEAAS